MQASIHLSSSPFLSLPFTETSSFSTTLLPAKHHHQGSRTSSTCISIKAASDVPQVDYSSMASSVFPAEACDTVGGDACNVEMFPETKFTQQQPDPNVKVPPTASKAVDREYLKYDSPKTVFIAEACDDLGGEFCEPSYQSGVN